MLKRNDDLNLGQDEENLPNKKKKEKVEIAALQCVDGYKISRMSRSTSWSSRFQLVVSSSSQLPLAIYNTIMSIIIPNSQNYYLG